jgi:class 3 adenylate cyclase
VTDKSVSHTLVVILHADVAGSTALVQQDEVLAHTRLTDAFHHLALTIEDYFYHELNVVKLISFIFCRFFTNWFFLISPTK